MNMKNFAILLALALVGGTILAGCSGGSEEDPNAIKKDPIPGGKADHKAEGNTDAAGGQQSQAPL